LLLVETIPEKIKFGRFLKRNATALEENV